MKVISLQEISSVLGMRDTNRSFIMIIIQEESLYQVPTDNVNSYDKTQYNEKCLPTNYNESCKAIDLKGLFQILSLYFYKATSLQVGFCSKWTVQEAFRRRKICILLDEDCLIFQDFPVMARDIILQWLLCKNKWKGFYIDLCEALLPDSIFFSSYSIKRWCKTGRKWSLIFWTH